MKTTLFLAVTLAVAVAGACARTDSIAAPNALAVNQRRMSTSENGPQDNVLFMSCTKAFQGRVLQGKTFSDVGLFLSDFFSVATVQEWCARSVSSNLVPECVARLTVLAGILPSQERGNPCLAAT